MSLIGDLGGVGDVIISIFGIVVNPYTAHNFSVGFLQKLYYGKTKKSKGQAKHLKNQNTKPSKKDKKLESTKKNLQN